MAINKIKIGSTEHELEASKLTTSKSINGMSFNGVANVANYGTCSTAAATAAKTVACDNFALVTGAEITVKFTVTNTAANPTLNVNGTGAKAIYYRGSAISAGYLAANRTYTFRYNGTQYDLVGDLDTNTTYSAATSSKLGLVKSGTDITVDSSGNVSVNDDSHNHIIANIDSLQDVLDGKASSTHTHTAAAVGAIANTAGTVKATNIASGAVSTSYTATISTSWTGSEAPYTQTITVSGILASDTPIVDMVPDSTYSTAQAQEEAWSKIYRIVTADDTITVYAHEKTGVSVPIKMVVIRK